MRINAEDTESSGQRGMGFTALDAWYPADPAMKERSLRCGLQRARSSVGMQRGMRAERLAAGYGAYY